MAWVGQGLTDHLVPTPLPWAELPGTGSRCPGTHPAWPWNPSGLRHPQLLWAAHASASPHSEEFFSSKLPFVQLKSILPCPTTSYICKKSILLLPISSFPVLKNASGVSSDLYSHPVLFLCPCFHVWLLKNFQKHIKTSCDVVYFCR